MSPNMIRRTIGGAALALGAMTLVGLAPGKAPSKVGGSFSLKYAEQHPLPVPGSEGHTLLIGRVQGTNRSTGPTRYMEGAAVSNLEFADLTQGNGPHQGYLTMISGADTVLTKWSGKVTTTMSDKTPMTSFEGTWTKAKGTGQYEGISGAGSYKGRFTSRTEYVVDWKGELSGGKLAEK